MIVSDQHSSEKRSLLNNDNDSRNEMPKTPVIEEGLPVYAPVDPHPEVKGEEPAPAPVPDRRRKFRRAIRLLIVGFVLFHLWRFSHRWFHSQPRFGFLHEHQGWLDSEDVTDEWVDGKYNFAYEDVKLAMADQVIEDSPSFDAPPDGPPHPIPPHMPSPPDAPPPPDMPHPPDAPHPPDMPHPPPPPHGSDMPDESDHPHPGHPGPHHPGHHVTVECLSDDGLSIPLTMQVPFVPSDDGYLPGGAFVDQEDDLISWTEPTSFNLSTSLPRLVVASHGSVAGSVHLHTDSSLDDIVSYNVSVTDSSLVKICKLLHKDVFFGVAVVGPHEHVFPVPKAKIEVFFPTEAHIHAFTSHTGIFHHEVDDLSSVHFGKFQLGASNAAIHINAVNAHVVAVKTTNSAIEAGTVSGKVVTLSSNNGRINGVVPNATTVVATTKNAPITLNATIWSTADAHDGRPAPPSLFRTGGCHGGKEGESWWGHWFSREGREERRERRKAWRKERKAWRKKSQDEDDEELPHGPHGPHHGPRGDGKGVLVAATTNGHVDVHTWLKSNATGSFSVVTKSTNDPVELGILEQPVNSTLSVTATSTNARVGVGLHPAFEGEFIVKTSNGKTELIETPNVDDPAGLHRERHILVNEHFPGLLLGSTYWGERKKHGVAVVTTSNAGVQLAV